MERLIHLTKNEEIGPALDHVLAEQTNLLAKLRSMKPENLTDRELRQLERDIYPTLDSMSEFIAHVEKLKSDAPSVIKRLQYSFENISVIMKRLREIHDGAGHLKS